MESEAKREKLSSTLAVSVDRAPQHKSQYQSLTPMANGSYEAGPAHRWPYESMRYDSSAIISEQKGWQYRKVDSPSNVNADLNIVFDEQWEPLDSNFIHDGQLASYSDPTNASWAYSSPLVTPALTGIWPQCSRYPDSDDNNASTGFVNGPIAQGR